MVTENPASTTSSMRRRLRLRRAAVRSGCGWSQHPRAHRSGAASVVLQVGGHMLHVPVRHALALPDPPEHTPGALRADLHVLQGVRQVLREELRHLPPSSGASAAGGHKTPALGRPCSQTSSSWQPYWVENRVSFTPGDSGLLPAGSGVHGHPSRSSSTAASDASAMKEAGSPPVLAVSVPLSAAAPTAQGKGHFIASTLHRFFNVSKADPATSAHAAAATSEQTTPSPTTTRTCDRGDGDVSGDPDPATPPRWAGPAAPVQGPSPRPVAPHQLPAATAQELSSPSSLHPPPSGLPPPRGRQATRSPQEEDRSHDAVYLPCAHKPRVGDSTLSTYDPLPCAHKPRVGDSTLSTYDPRQHCARYLGRDPAVVAHVRAANRRLALWVPPPAADAGHGPYSTPHPDLGTPRGTLALTPADPAALQIGTEVTVQGQANPNNGLRGVIIGSYGDVNQYWTVTLTNGSLAHLLPSSLIVATPAPSSSPVNALTTIVQLAGEAAGAAPRPEAPPSGTRTIPAAPAQGTSPHPPPLAHASHSATGEEGGDGDDGDKPTTTASQDSPGQPAATRPTARPPTMEGRPVPRGPTPPPAQHPGAPYRGQRPPWPTPAAAPRPAPPSQRVGTRPDPLTTIAASGTGQRPPATAAKQEPTTPSAAAGLPPHGRPNELGPQHPGVPLRGLRPPRPTPAAVPWPAPPSQRVGTRLDPLTTIAASGSPGGVLTTIVRPTPQLCDSTALHSSATAQQPESTAAASSCPPTLGLTQWGRARATSLTAPLGPGHFWSG